MTDPVPSKELMPHWTCKTHGDFDARVAVGCPECVRTMREQIADLKRDNVRWENAHKILLAEIERLKQKQTEVGVDNLGDNDEYARCRSLDDQQIIREAMETPIRMVHELGNRYDVVCEKLERAAPEPPAARLPIPADWDLASRLNVVYNRLFLDCRLCEQEEAEILYAAIVALRAAQPPAVINASNARQISGMCCTHGVAAIDDCVACRSAQPPGDGR
jgi:hypothetical protein